MGWSDGLQTVVIGFVLERGRVRMSEYSPAELKVQSKIG